MNYKYEDYINLGIYPDIANGELQFSKGNIDFIIEKYLKILTEFYVYKQRTLAIENEYDNQFMMIKADVDYYKSQYKQYFNELKELKLLNRRYDRFEKINAGLRQECKRYKQELLKLKLVNSKSGDDV